MEPVNVSEVELAEYKKLLSQINEEYKKITLSLYWGFWLAWKIGLEEILSSCASNKYTYTDYS